MVQIVLSAENWQICKLLVLRIVGKTDILFRGCYRKPNTSIGRFQQLLWVGIPDHRGCSRGIIAQLPKRQQREIRSVYFDSECLVTDFQVATTADVILNSRVSTSILESKNYKALVVLSLCMMLNCTRRVDISNKFGLAIAIWIYAKKFTIKV